MPKYNLLLFNSIGQLDFVDADTLGWWLAERQLPSGGLNGRPEKLPDVCYSWWVFSSLNILGRDHWIDKEQLKTFILASQVKINILKNLNVIIYSIINYELTIG